MAGGGERLNLRGLMAYIAYGFWGAWGYARGWICAGGACPNGENVSDDR